MKSCEVLYDYLMDKYDGEFYIDIDNYEVLGKNDLEDEFKQAIKYTPEEYEDCTLEDYIYNSLTKNGGSLEEGNLENVKEYEKEILDNNKINISKANNKFLKHAINDKDLYKYLDDKYDGEFYIDEDFNIINREDMKKEFEKAKENEPETFDNMNLDDYIQFWVDNGQLYYGNPVNVYEHKDDIINNNKNIISKSNKKIKRLVGKIK